MIRGVYLQKRKLRYYLFDSENLLELWRRSCYMQRYIALLRGINISGKNKIAMSELKEMFIALGFADVVTCLNSGNVIF